MRKINVNTHFVVYLILFYFSCVLFFGEFNVKSVGLSIVLATFMATFDMIANAIKKCDIGHVKKYSGELDHSNNNLITRVAVTLNVIIKFRNINPDDVSEETRSMIRMALHIGFNDGWKERKKHESD
jgi:hypothetical protein